jgi:hypothetical protein
MRMILVIQEVHWVALGIDWSLSWAMLDRTSIDLMSI